MIPAGLLRVLPHVGLAAALIGAVWWIDHQGYQRATRDAETHDLRLRTQLQSDLRALEQTLSGTLAVIDADTANTRAAIQQARHIIQPAIVKELTRETRYSDPAAGISDSLRAAIDRARAAVACATAPDGAIVCTLPAAQPPQGQ